MRPGHLLNAGLRAPIEPPAGASPALRARLATGLSQVEFAERYCLDVADLRAWEAAEPCDGAGTYLRLVEMFPDQIGKLVALWRVSQ